MKKIGIVITDGVGFRNFILSDFLTEAEKTFDEVVVLSCLPEAIYSGFLNTTKVIELPVFQEAFKTWIFRKAKEVAHLRRHRNNNFGIFDNYNFNKSKAKNPRGYATRLLYALTAIFNTEKSISAFNRMQQATFKNNPITKGYEELLKAHDFDILFFTHQRPPFIAPLAYVAKKMKITSCSFIFSWDNLASKGRMAADFDYFLVWSDLMQRELLHFYPHVKKENTAIVGTPQFEPYVLERYASDQSEFHSLFNLNPLKKTICFSCGDIATSPNDELYIETIANAILEGKIEDVNLVIRTSPAEDPARFLPIAAKFPFLKWNYPKWELARIGHQEAWSQRFPSVDDVTEMRSLLEYSHLNINMLSTMSLDFMQFEKPVINVVFGNQDNNLYDDQRFLEYAHIINVVKSNASTIAKNKIELIEAINQYLKNPLLQQAQRTNLLQMQVSKPLHGTGKRIAETLFQWA
ncbi:MAG: hypothetical protein PSV16_10155 [Flavobacterium sp.]|nr:hypothetical protein [Flavobacterium sp.]